MSKSSSKFPLHLHSYDSLAATLLRGESVPIGNQRPLQFKRPSTRSALAWYVENRPHWDDGKTLRVRKEHCEEIVDRIKEEPPTPTATEVPSKGHDGQRLLMRRLRANQFGGLHRYAKTDGEARIFECDFKDGLTVIEGKNGSGKSSLLSAICWCLTGTAFRTVEEPKRVSDDKLVIQSEESLGRSDDTRKKISLLAPIPPGDILDGTSAKTISVNTWVEVKLEDKDEPTKQFTIRRSLQVGRRGRIEEKLEGMDRLNISPLGLRMGTQLPAQVPFIDFDSPSGLGRAAASLTGLRPFIRLAQHARRVAEEKLPKELTRQRRREQEELSQDYEEGHGRLARQLAELPEAIQEKSIPGSLGHPDIMVHLQELKGRLEAEQERLLGAATEILGPSFDSSNRVLRAELSRNIPKALAALTSKRLAPKQARSALAM